MKRIISLLTVLVVLFSMLTTATAANIETDVLTDISIRVNGETSYSNSVSKTLNSVSDIPNVDVIANLNMTAVQNAADIALGNRPADFASLQAAGYVKADITVVVEYPATLTIDRDAAVFSYATPGNPSPFIYDEVSRTLVTDGEKNKLTILLTTQKPLNELYANKTTYLDSLNLEVTNVDIPDFGTYTFEGTVVCNTKLYSSLLDLQNNATPFRSYTFTSVQDSAAGKPDPYTSGKISATAKFEKYTPVSGGGAGSIPNKITVSSSHPSGELSAGTKVKLSSSVASAKIYYTTDGTDPQIDENGNLVGSTKLYSGEFPVVSDTTVKAMAVAASGKVKSEIETWVYTVKGVDVTVTPGSSQIRPGTEITINTNKGQIIYYTIDGSEPMIDKDGNPLGTTKKYVGPFLIFEDITVRAIAVNEDGEISIVATENYTISPELTDEHIAYIQGYPDHEFKPERPITRGEVAEIFARLTVKKINVETEYKASFTDVPEDSWYHNSIAFMEKSGIINGYADGTFRPDNYITRAEFATMASRFDMLEDVNENIFSDVTTLHWAFFNINSAYKKGWINGYPGDTNFYPSNLIKRCEAVTIVNRMTGRNAEKEFKNADLTGFIIFDDTNNPSAHWSFYEVVESSNTHDVNK